MSQKDKLKASEKTNVMRVLEQKKVDYIFHNYTDTQAIAGMEVAQVLGQNPDEVFKTLVTVGRSGEHYVFVVPVNKELDLKKAASAVKEKNIEMIKSKELLPLTGYIHGGCSPIGMKKQFVTVFHSSFNNLEKLCFSAGRIGCQVELKTSEVSKVIKYQTADICKE